MRDKILLLLAALMSFLIVFSLTQVLFPDYRSVQEFDPSPENSSLFSERSEDLGLNYTSINDFEDRPGIFVADVTNDGFREVLLTGGENPVLYRNTGGEFEVMKTFRIDGKVKLAHFVDYNSDGLEDLIFFPQDKPVLYLNENGTLVKDSKLIDRRIKRPQGAASADFNLDGCPDIFIVQWGSISSASPINRYILEKDRENKDYNFPRIENGLRNLLFMGSCGGEFKDATKERNITGNRWSLAVTAADFNQDDLPDIHVANDFGPDTLYVNRGNSFEKRSLGHYSDRHGMTSNIGDFNHDLKPDIFVTNIFSSRKDMSPMNCYIEFSGNCILGKENFLYPNIRNFEGNNLFINKGNLTFEDEAGTIGGQRGGWAWGATVGDFDNNGYIDILQTRYKDSEFQRMIFWNGSASGLEAANSSNLGIYSGLTRMVVTIDVDRDGCLDAITNNRNNDKMLDLAISKNFRLYYNNDCDDNFIQIDLKGSETKGAELVLKTTNRSMYRVKNSRTGYVSQSTRLIHFGLMRNEKPENLTIEWPDGSKSSFTNLSRGGKYVFAK